MHYLMHVKRKNCKIYTDLDLIMNLDILENHMTLKFLSAIVEIINNNIKATNSK